MCKQMMQKLLLRKMRPHLSCQNKMKPVRLGRTPKTRDDMIYTFKEGMYRLYHVKAIEENENENEFTCKEFNIEEKYFRRHQTLDFGSVGVFKNLGYKTVTVVVKDSEIAGKVIAIGCLLLTSSKNVLTEY